MFRAFRNISRLIFLRNKLVKVDFSSIRIRKHGNTVIIEGQELAALNIHLAFTTVKNSIIAGDANTIGDIKLVDIKTRKTPRTPAATSTKKVWYHSIIQ
jgi:hypothetical protein